MSKFKEIIIGAINKSPSEVEAGFASAIKHEVLNRIEAKRAEVGANILMNLPSSEQAKE